MTAFTFTAYESEALQRNWKSLMGNFILIWSLDCDFNFAIGTQVIVVKTKIIANFYRKSVSKMINMVVFTYPGNLK